MRSAISATTPKSCVMNRTPVPRRSCISLISLRICACVVTSSAVVGSSAISSDGSRTSAIAIMMRWRCPPESWCGKASTILSGSGRWTASMISIARWRRSAALIEVWISSTSAICSPTRVTGFSAVIGSWKIIAMRVPRRSRRRLFSAVSVSSPSNSVLPPVGRSASGRRPMTADAVTDLPDPLSPTTQTISPGATVKLMFSTALGRSAFLGSATVRPLTSRTYF